MSLLSNLETRLNYAGGVAQQDRMVQSKLRALKKSLLYSYQAVTVELADGKQYRALLNRDQEKIQTQYGVLSIPFKDICLNEPFTGGKTSENLSDINLKTGDVFTCVDMQNKWIIYLIHHQEKAYLRADVLLCNAEIEINNIHYDIHVSGHDVNMIEWISTQRKNLEVTDPNYDLNIVITKDSNTDNFFKRYKKIYLFNKTWETQVVSRQKDDNLLFISLKENYNNSYDISTQTNNNEVPSAQIVNFCKKGSVEISPYSTELYEIKDEYLNENGYFNIIDLKNIIIIRESNNQSIKIQAATGTKGSFVLQYKVNDSTIFEENIRIVSA